MKKILFISVFIPFFVFADQNDKLTARTLDSVIDVLEFRTHQEKPQNTLVTLSLKSGKELIATYLSKTKDGTEQTLLLHCGTNSNPKFCIVPQRNIEYIALDSSQADVKKIFMK